MSIELIPQILWPAVVLCVSGYGVWAFSPRRYNGIAQRIDKLEERIGELSDRVGRLQIDRSSQERRF